MAAVDDLDLAAQAGSPGTDSSLAGGTLPTFIMERGADTMTWKVMNGILAATSMTAKLDSLDVGARTRVTTQVVRDDRPLTTWCRPRSVRQALRRVSLMRL